MAWDISDLFQRHGAELRRFLCRRGASADTAADLTQETFLRLLTAAPDVPVTNARAYIFRTANNLSIDNARRQRVSPFFDAAEELLDGLVDRAPSPEQVLLSRQELAVLQKALDQVPSGPREVFLARVVDGKTFDEIGRTLGLPAQTANSQMIRVMMHLKAALDAVGR